MRQIFTPKALIAAAAAVSLLGFTATANPFAGTLPASWERAWPDTDFSKSSVEFDEIMSGGPPKDGIPAINGPTLIALDKADLEARESVVSVKINGDARAYPIRYLMWHEIVNDSFGEQPVTITYCPLCNSSIAFDGRLGERELDFGVSGMLRNSDMVMYDRQTESWWQQFTGEAIIGELHGEELTKIPSRLESWEQFIQREPEGRVMDQPRGYRRDYGRNPYRSYDTADRPFLYFGEEPPHNIPLMARIVVVGERAWPVTRIMEEGPLSEAGVTISWRKGQASALDTARVSKGREVGTIEVADASGNPVVHDVTFAFVFQAFHPDGEWMIDG